MPGITVDLWHTNCEGYYSADTSPPSEAGPGWGAICTNNNTARINEARSAHWHRGSQVSDGDGVVYFKTCFPGWYTGRVAHAHIRFSENNQVIHFTQFAWPDAIAEEIHVGHPEYIGQKQDTPLSGRDPEFGNNIDPELLLDVNKQEDGSILCSKVITIT